MPFSFLVTSGVSTAKRQLVKDLIVLAFFLVLMCAGSTASPDLESSWRAALQKSHAFGDHDLRFASAAHGLAAVLLDRGKTQEAKQLLETALPVLETSFGSQHREVVLCAFRLAKCYAYLGQYPEAETLLLKTKPAMERAFGATDPHFAEMLVTLGILYRVTSRYRESEAVLSQAIKMLDASSGADARLTGLAQAELGSTYYCLGQHREAIYFLGQGLKVLKDLQANESGFFLINIASAYFALGHLNQADTTLQRTLIILSSHPEMYDLKALALSKLSLVKLRQSRRGEADSYIRQAKAIAETNKLMPGVRLSLLDSLGNYYLAEGDLSRCGETYQSALVLMLSTAGPLNPDTAEIYRTLAKLRLREKRFDEAALCYEKTTEIAERALPPSHPLYAVYLGEYAALLRKLKRKDEAKQLEHRARMIREQNPSQMLAGATVNVHELQNQTIERTKPTN